MPQVLGPPRLRLASHLGRLATDPTGVSGLAEQVVNGAERVWLEKERLEAPLPRGGRLALIRKRPLGGAARGAVLLVHGFATNRYFWHLSTRSLTAYLVARGYETFNLELRGHGRSRELGAPPAASFEEHVDEDLPAAAEALAAAGHERFFLLGHSLGGAMAYAAAPRLGARLKGVVTLSGVFRWGGGARVIAALVPLLHAADRVHRRIRARSGPVLRVDLLGRLMAGGLGSIERGLVPLPARIWAQGSVERPVLREWLTHALDRTTGSILALLGRWAATGAFCDTAGARDYAARWAECKVPVLVAAADRDELADALRDVRPAYECAASSDRTFRIFGRAGDGVAFGHMDLVMGREAPARVWPLLADWLDAH